MNLLLSVDSNYLEKAKTMLYSLRMNNRKTEIIVFLLNQRLSAKEVICFKDYLVKYRITLVEIDINDDWTSGLTEGNLNFTIEMYNRIFAQFFLPLNLDRVLWLDADIIIRKNLSEFYNSNFEQNAYVVCRDMSDNTKWVNEVKTKLNLPLDYKYFNSGVLLINLEYLRKKTTQEFLLSQCSQLQDKLTYPDQDILNYLYQGKVKYADPLIYNYQLSGRHKIPKNEEKNITILHYTGQEKPWNYWQIHNSSKFYWLVRFKQGYRIETIKAYVFRIVDYIKRGK